jgi:hypothetical protein
VPGFPDFYNILYDSELDSEGNITDTTAIYTYRLLDDYRAKKLEIIQLPFHCVFLRWTYVELFFQQE